MIIGIMQGKPAFQAFPDVIKIARALSVRSLGEKSPSIFDEDRGAQVPEMVRLGILPSCFISPHQDEALTTFGDGATDPIGP